MNFPLPAPHGTPQPESEGEPELPEPPATEKKPLYCNSQTAKESGSKDLFTVPTSTTLTERGARPSPPTNCNRGQVLE
jgi:hypothetical protein